MYSWFGTFFSSICSRSVKGLGFFSLCLVDVHSRQAFPLLMEQLDPKMKRETTVKKKSTSEKDKKKKKGRPKGSKNKNNESVELTEYLQWIQGNIKKVLQIMGNKVKPLFFLYDGAFGNNPCLQMVNACGLTMISKLQCKSALWFAFEGEQKRKGKNKKYGEKVNYQDLPARYLMKRSIENGVEETIYQVSVWHKSFFKKLNVTIIQRKRFLDGKTGQVILFSDDLDLSWENMILYYRLRFQIEFTFRDAKQFWGLEDFMNIKKETVQNAANLAMFMVNVSRSRMYEKEDTSTSSIIDLKARSQATFYVQKILKINPEIQRLISFDELKQSISDIGCIYPEKIAV